MTDSQVEHDRGVLDRFLNGTNLGSFQTLVFQLRYIGKFTADERTILWDEEILDSGTVLPGTETTMYLDSEGSVYLAVDDKDDRCSEHIYMVYTTSEGCRLLDRSRPWKDYWWMRARNWWWNRWH